MASKRKSPPTTDDKKKKSSEHTHTHTHKKKRVIRPAKYKRFLKFMQTNKFPLDNIQKFEVFDLQSKGEDVMPWGKFSGESIIDLWRNLIEGGRSYLLWLYKQDIKHIELKDKLEELRQKEIVSTGLDPCC